MPHSPISKIIQSPVRIELGSGPYGVEGFTHVDAVKLGNVDIASDIKSLNWLDTESVDELYAAHVVEHISYTAIAAVLLDWYRVLKTGGKITIKMPDVGFLCRSFVGGVHSTEEVMVSLFGGFADFPGGPDGWEKVSGNKHWERNTIKDGEILYPGVYTEWGAHKAMYTFESFKPRMIRAGFINVLRVVENDWELNVVGTK